MLLKPTTVGVSVPEVIMIANVFTMPILCVTLKPTTFGVSFPEVIMIANVLTSQKYRFYVFFFVIKPTKTNVALKGKN